MTIIFENKITHAVSCEQGARKLDASFLSRVFPHLKNGMQSLKSSPFQTVGDRKLRMVRLKISFQAGKKSHIV